MKSVILCFIALSFCKLSAEANQSAIPSSESEVSIDNVTYEYKVFNEADNRIDCTGTINFTINIPTGCQRLLLVRTREHTVDSDRLSFSIKTQLPIVDDSSAMSVSLPDMSWGTYFRIFAYFENERYFNLYGVRKEDMSNYDFVLNTTKLTPIQVKDTIIQEYKKWKNK